MRLNDGWVSTTLVTALRVLLGGVFLSSGWQKLDNLQLFYQTAQGYKILTPELTQLYAGWLPWLEILAGALLLLGLFRRFAAGLLGALLLSFLIALGWVLFRGETVHCGCFLGGSQASPVTWELWFRDLFLLIAAGYLVWVKSIPWSLDALLERKPLLKKAAVVIVLAVLSVTGLEAFNSKVPPPPTAGIRPLLPVGTFAPDFQLPDTSGTVVSLQSFRNRQQVLIEIFATWCPHCQHSVPLLNQLQESRLDSLKVLAINAGDPLDKPSTALAFKLYFKADYTILDRPSQGLMNLYQISSFPTFYLIGKDGRILWMHMGTLDEKTARELERHLR